MPCVLDPVRPFWPLFCCLPRRPLGLTIIGGLLVSQVLTLITTPVVYMYLDRFRRRKTDESYLSRHFSGGGSAPAPAANPAE